MSGYRVEYARYDLGRVARVSHTGTLPEVIRWLAGCAHPTGPNGPLWSADLYRPDGSAVPEAGWADEIRAAGFVPQYALVDGRPDRLVDAGP